MNGFNLSDITDAKLGATTLGSIYLGSTKLWPLGAPLMYKDWTNYEKQYFTVEILEDNCSIAMYRAGSGSYTAPAFSFSYSINGGNWVTISWGATTSAAYWYVPDSNDNRVYFSKGDIVRFKSTRQNWGQTVGFYGARDTSFNFIKKVKVYGNINSLIKGDDFYKNYYVSDVNTQGMFTNLFNAQSPYRANLTDISNLFVPSYKCANKGSDSSSNATNSMQFDSTFANCTAITKLPMMDLYVQGNEYFRYYNLFRYDSALTDAENFVLYSSPNSLGYYGLSGVLKNCTALTKGPRLNVKGVTTGSFDTFYDSDSSLTDVEINITTLGSGFNGPWCNNTTNLTQIKTNKSSEKSNTNFISGKTLVASKFIDPAYFTIESLEDNNLIEIIIKDTYNMYWDVWVNGTNIKHNWSSTQGSYTTIATLNKGDIMQILQNSSSRFKISKISSPFGSSFRTSGKFIIYGNLSSMSSNSIPTDVAKDGEYADLFNGCDKLVDAYHLILPYNTVTYTHCFDCMFKNCTALERAPRLLKTTASDYNEIFSYMFQGCTSLYEGPEIYMTTSHTINQQYNNIVKGMFYDCVNLEYVGLRYPNRTNISSEIHCNDWLTGTTPSKLTINTNVWLLPYGHDYSVPTGATLINNKSIYET